MEKGELLFRKSTEIPEFVDGCLAGVKWSITADVYADPVGSLCLGDGDYIADVTVSDKPLDDPQKAAGTRLAVPFSYMECTARREWQLYEQYLRGDLAGEIAWQLFLNTHTARGPLTAGRVLVIDNIYADGAGPDPAVIEEPEVLHAIFRTIMDGFRIWQAKQEAYHGGYYAAYLGLSPLDDAQAPRSRQELIDWGRGDEKYITCADSKHATNRCLMVTAAMSGMGVFNCTKTLTSPLTQRHFIILAASGANKDAVAELPVYTPPLGKGKDSPFTAERFVTVPDRRRSPADQYATAATYLDGRGRIVSEVEIVDPALPSYTTVRLRMTMEYHNCLGMALQDVVEDMEYESAKAGEVAWQMFCNSRVARIPFRLGNVIILHDIELVSGDDELLRLRSHYFELAVDAVLDSFMPARTRNTLRKKSPMYIAYLGRWGANTASLSRWGMDAPIKLCTKQTVKTEDGGEEQRWMLADRTILALAARTKMAVIACTAPLTPEYNDSYLLAVSNNRNNHLDAMPYSRIPLYTPRYRG